MHKMMGLEERNGNIVKESWDSDIQYLLVFNSFATRRLRTSIGWLRDDFPENKCEQGGWLLGKYIMDSNGIISQAEVMDILVARTECRLPGYIEWSAEEEISLQNQFFEMQADIEKIDPALAADFKVIGWWHTHPNSLPVFMSETDMETQRLKYYKPEKYSVVLNPHKGIWKAYAGKDAVEVPSIMLFNNADSEANEVKVDNDKNLYERRMYKRNRQKRRTQYRKRKG